MKLKYNKTFILVGLFVIVLTVGILLKTDTGQGYISWLKATASSIFGMNVEAPSKGAEDNINYSNTDSLNKDSKVNKAKTSNESDEPVLTDISVPGRTTVNPADIENKIKEISAQVAKITAEVNQIAINNQVQRQIDQIAIQVDKVGQEVNILRTGAQITEIQNRVSVLSQQVGFLTQQLSPVA